MFYRGLSTACLMLFVVAMPVQAGFLDDLFGTSGDGETGPTSGSTLSQDQIGGGLKDALRVGTERVVGQLGTKDGFNADPDIHIPLPKSLKRVRKALKYAGMAGVMDDLEVRLNRAAEDAVPHAKELFWQAITDMTIDDVVGIYKGGDDAATRYFQAKMTPGLTAAMQPVVDESLADVGALALYDQAISEYKGLPFVPDVRTDLTAYVVEKGLDGVFLYLAREEADIRNNPLAQTTDILKTVFGGK